MNLPNPFPLLKDITKYLNNIQVYDICVKKMIFKMFNFWYFDTHFDCSMYSVYICSSFFVNTCSFSVKFLLTFVFLTVPLLMSSFDHDVIPMRMFLSRIKSQSGLPWHPPMLDTVHLPPSLGFKSQALSAWCKCRGDDRSRHQWWVMCVHQWACIQVPLYSLLIQCLGPHCRCTAT